MRPWVLLPLRNVWLILWGGPGNTLSSSTEDLPITCPPAAACCRLHCKGIFCRTQKNQPRTSPAAAEACFTAAQAKQCRPSLPRCSSPPSIDTSNASLGQSWRCLCMLWMRFTALQATRR